MIWTPFLHVACLTLCVSPLQDAPGAEPQEPEVPKAQPAAAPAADLRLHAERVYTGTGERSEEAHV